MPIANALTARIRLWQKFKVFLNSCISFCCNSCHFADVYALKSSYYNTCADLKGGDFRKRGGGGVFRLPPPCMNPCLHAAPPHLRSSWHAWAAFCVVQSTSHPPSSTPSHSGMGAQGLQPSSVTSSDQIGRQPSLCAVLVLLVWGEVHR